jgi:8-oxo-dGTP pyrophosphatase MutT (NUDIX family)
MTWKPHATVAAVIERDGRFLMVEEESEGEIVYNQPAGHLDPNESLLEAAVRETREETGWNFHPQHLIGVYRWVHGPTNRTYLRVCFSGECDDYQPHQPLDEGILQTLWLSRDELLAENARLRSPLVMRCIEDYLAGHRYPIQILADIPS